MSRTDAHRPYWVQVMHAQQDHEWYSYERHNHESHECDIADAYHGHSSSWNNYRVFLGYVGKRMQYYWQHCDVDIDWSQRDRYYPRDRAAGYDRKKYWRAERARVRAEIAKGREVIEPSCPRNSVLWDLW